MTFSANDPARTLTPGARRLQSLLAEPGMLTFPTCFDALSARLTRDAGFPLTFMSGFGVAATRLGVPDVGLITSTEMTDQLRNICNAVGDYPVIADGDTGYGNAMNVRRTVIDYARAGAACIMLEDQVTPKKCGHFEGKQVVSRDEARMKIRAAVQAGREAGILILARTDARAVLGFEAALERCRDFEAEGADIVFLEAPENEAEMRAFASSTSRPTLANLSPGIKTPMLPGHAVAAMGFKLASYHPLLFSATSAMQAALEALRADASESGPPAILHGDFKELVGYSAHCELESRYGHKLDAAE